MPFDVLSAVLTCILYHYPTYTEYKKSLQFHPLSFSVFQIVALYEFFPPKFSVHLLSAM